MVYDTNIFEQITASEDNPNKWFGREYDREIINMAQYNAMIKAIESKIEYMIKQTLKRSKMDDVMDSLETIIQDSSANLNDVNIKEVVNKINSIDKVDEKALAQALIDTKYNDTNKVVDISEAKANSDGEE